VSHMVIFQTPGGSPGYNQFDSVNEAVAFVEKLRNEQGIENARMFALEEIKFDIKTYYRVELQALNSGAGAPSGQPGAAAGEPQAFSAPQQPAPAPAPQAPAPQAQPAPAPAPMQPAPAPQPQPAPAPAPQAQPAPAPAPQAQPAPAPAPEPEAPAPRRGLFGR